MSVRAQERSPPSLGVVGRDFGGACAGVCGAVWRCFSAGYGVARSGRVARRSLMAASDGQRAKRRKHTHHLPSLHLSILHCGRSVPGKRSNALRVPAHGLHRDRCRRAARFDRCASLSTRASPVASPFRLAPSTPRSAGCDVARATPAPVPDSSPGAASAAALRLWNDQKY